MSTVIDVDLSRYFDTIRQSVLLDKIAKRYHRTTVSGVTMISACFHPDQNRVTAIQKSLSKRLRVGRECHPKDDICSQQ